MLRWTLFPSMERCVAAGSGVRSWRRLPGRSSRLARRKSSVRSILQIILKLSPEGQAPVGDPAVDEAYDGLGQTFEFYLEKYQRNSIDDQGMPLIGTVHYGNQFNNAFFDGRQMVFGDGDGAIFNRFTTSKDVIGHELTHGVTASEANLEYQDQSGALNESVSDVFGSLVKQYVLKQTASEADWLIGAGLLTFEGQALRSMKAPGTAFDNNLMGKD